MQLFAQSNIVWPTTRQPGHVAIQDKATDSWHKMLVFSSLTLIRLK